MNRHQSNPFLSDWDDDDADARAALIAQANAHLSQAGEAAFPPAGEDKENHHRASEDAQPRRSSMSQTEGGPNYNNSNNNNNNSSGSSSNASQARASLYKRNMSSFEAASLQLAQHEQQMLESGGGAGGGGSASCADTQKDLIARMTAEFQQAIRDGADQQAESHLSFNPFDPFETIVDDDVNPNSPAPAATASNHANTAKFVMPAAADGYDDAAASDAAATTNAPAQRTIHDSIDDDEEELVSTPVRNIKSSPIGTVSTEAVDEAPRSTGNHQQQADDGQQRVEATMQIARGGGGGGQDAEQECDSIQKAALFASLLASAEPPTTDALRDASSPVAPDDDAYESGGIEAASTHVIKGSPKSAGGDTPDRPVSFFDPFETVIDKDALTHLVSEAHQQQQQQQTTNYYQPDQRADTSDREGADSPAPHHHYEARLPTGRVAESVSVETVIENTNSNGRDNKAAELGDLGEDQCMRETASSNAKQQQEAPALARSIALERPRASARPLEPPAPLSGIAAPQPTPAKKRTKPQVTRHKASFQEDSSDSSEEDDRIQIVICPRDASKTGAQGDAPIVVPLLPPPPSKSSMRQARERGQVDDMPSPIMSYKSRAQPTDDLDSASSARLADAKANVGKKREESDEESDDEGAGETRGRHVDEDDERDDGAFVIPMTHPDDEDGDNYGKPETPLYDDDTSYVLDDYPAKFDGSDWEMMLRYPPKKKLTANRFWKKIFVRLAQVPLAPVADKSAKATNSADTEQQPAAAMCTALQIFDSRDDKKPMQEIPIQATYTVSEISSQLFDQFGKIFTIKLQYIFYKERVGVRQGQLARFIHTGHIGTSTTSGGHGVDPISIGAIKRMGAPIEHSPQISQIIKLGCASYEDIKTFKEALEDCLFRMPIHRDRALTTYKTEEVQMAVRDETYVEVNQIGTITKQLARVRLFFLSFLNGMPVIEVGINDFHRQGREIVGRMDILPVVTEEWIRLEAWEVHSTVDKEQFDNPNTRLVKLTPPDATFFELMRFRIRPPRNRELPLQISANMSVTRTKACINCEVMVPGCVSRKHGQIPCENIAIRVHIPECWIYFFREEKHFRMGSKKSVNRRPGKVKGIERFLGGSGPQDFSDDSSLIEVTSGQAKYEHHHHAIVWRAARWPKETQSAYVQNTMKIRLPLTAYDKMPESFYEYVHVEYTMPATTVSHTTLRSISVQPCDDEPPEKYVKYAAKYEYKVRMRQSINLGGGQLASADAKPEASPIVIIANSKQADRQDDLQREPDSDDGDNDDEDDDRARNETDLK